MGTENNGMQRAASSRRSQVKRAMTKLVLIVGAVLVVGLGYFFVGRHDFTANPELSRAYFEAIHAPVKGLYVFEDSAHSPLFEEPERATEILLRDVMGGSNSHTGVPTAETNDGDRESLKHVRPEER